MEHNRKNELGFLIRTSTPVTLVESRTYGEFNNVMYDDFFSLQELVQENLLDYIGHSEQYFYLRPTQDFSVYIIDEIRDLRAGEIVKLGLTSTGKREFEAWLATVK